MHTSFARAPFALVLAASLAASYIGVAVPARADQASDVPSYAQPDPNAQPESNAQPAVEPFDAQPAAPPGVARLSVVDGQVGVKHGDAGDQAAATVNTPVVAGDYITTGNDGRAEVQLDPANVIRAGAGTQLRFTQLDGANDVAQIAEGTVELRVFASGQDNVQVETPSVDVEPSEAGEYIVSVTNDGNTQITARSGSLAVVTPQGTQEVEPGRTMVVAGSATSPQYQYIDEVAQTDVEAWGDQRDQMLASAENAPSQDVAADMTGGADLDQYGNWVDIPGYGNAWVPSDVAPGWSPYSSGSWVNLSYYGPTWVGSEPWGWAPYHYGRWLYAPTVGWAWTPGRVYGRPVWSPALVAFFGFGGGVGVGFGNVGWVPLAPGEFYRPWWGRGASISLGFSFNNYRNYAHGFVGVPYSTWQHGTIDRAHAMSVGALQSTRFYQGSMPTSRFAANTQYSNRSLASNFPRPQYQRFNAIHAAAPSGWQRFGQAAPRSQGYRASAPGWQRFNGATQQRYAGYQAQRQYQSQRAYSQSYPQQRQYGGYQAQRQYGAYQAQRQYGGYQAQRQYGRYQGQRQYAAPQRQYQSYRQSYRPQQTSRSAPSHTSNRGGDHPRGPGRP